MVLAISLGFNLYHRSVIQNKEATTNNMRVEAFEAWLHHMKIVKYFLEPAETNLDVKDIGYQTLVAKQIVDALISGIDIFEHPEGFYYWVDKATSYFHDAMEETYMGNLTGAVTERNLEPNVLNMIRNITRTIGSLYGRTQKTVVESILLLNGVDPARQLREAGVISDILKYLQHIYQASVNIYNYYN